MNEEWTTPWYAHNERHEDLFRLDNVIRDNLNATFDDRMELREQYGD